MKTFFLTSLAKAINAYLALDLASKLRLKKLKAHVITIELLPVHFIFQCKFDEVGVYIHSGELLEAEARICGTPLQLLSVMLAKNNRQSFFSDDVKMEGNAELAQEMIELFDELHIDWEEYLSHLTGDTTAHHISHFVGNVKNWLQQTEKTFSQNINEYVHEEANWLPGNEVLEDFFMEIDNLRMDTDRIEAKINSLREEIISRSR